MCCSAVAYIFNNHFKWAEIIVWTSVGSLHSIKWVFVKETGSKYARWVGEYPPNVCT